MLPLLLLPLAQADDCAGCHAARHAEWAGSQHATAFTDPGFQAAWRPWPDAWCLQCHAPLLEAWAPAGSKLDPDDPRLDAAGPAGQGVACEACHQTHDPEPALISGERCAGCHDFAFQHHADERGGTPWPMTFSTEPLQDTWDEWRGSWFAERGVTCGACHGEHGGHAFPGGHDLALVQRTLSLDLRWDGPALVATLTAEGAGHRVPTGDPFRRVVLEVCAADDPACATPVARLPWGRRFARTDRSWALAEDTTVPPPTAGPSASRALRVTPPPDAARYRLVFHFADPALGLPDALDRTVLAEGALPPRPGAAP